MLLEVPEFLLLAIIVKISPNAFVRLLKSSKIVLEFIEKNRKKIRIHSNINLTINLRKDFAPWLAESQLKPDELVLVGNTVKRKLSVTLGPNCLELAQLGYFKFNDVQMIGHTEELLEQLEKFPPKCNVIYMERYQDIRRTLRIFKPEKVKIGSYGKVANESEALLEKEDLENVNQFVIYDAYKHFNSQKVVLFLEHSAPYCQYFELDCTIQINDLKKSVSYIIERMLKDPNCRLKELMIKHGMGEYFDVADYFPSARLCGNLGGSCFWSIRKGENIIAIVQKNEHLLCTLVGSAQQFRTSYIKNFCPECKTANGTKLFNFYSKHIETVERVVEQAFREANHLKSIIKREINV